MKENTIKTIVLPVLVIVIIAMVTEFILPNNNQKYSRPGVIIDNNTVKTNDGNIWKYDTKYKKGSKVKVSFNDKNTDNIFDDEVLKVELK